jgi:hypothetical protein
MRNVYEFVWQARFAGELLFLTNEYIIFFVGGESEYPAVFQVCKSEKACFLLTVI